MLLNLLDPARRATLFRYELVDTGLSMGVGWLVNSAMIIVAAAVFFRHGIKVTSIAQASKTLQPLVGPLARFLFGVALLVAGGEGRVRQHGGDVPGEALAVAGGVGHPTPEPPLHAEAGKAAGEVQGSERRMEGESCVARVE